MGYRVIRIKQLEEENKALESEKDYWHREALKWAAMMGESKIKFRELLNQFGIPEDNFKDNELEKFLYDNRQQDKGTPDETNMC